MLAVVVAARKLGSEHCPGCTVYTYGTQAGRVPERSRLCVNMLAVHRSNEYGEVDRACNHARVLNHTFIATDCGYDSCDAVCLDKGYGACVPSASTAAFEHTPLWAHGCVTQPNTSPGSFRAQTSREGGFVCYTGTTLCGAREWDASYAFYCNTYPSSFWPICACENVE